MRRVSRNRGYFDRRAWPGGEARWGATATSLPLVGGTMLLRELERGEIRHALAISIPEPKASVFSWPAQRTDGFSHKRRAIPAGTRFRLNPKLDVASLNLPPLLDTMARAAQRYGLVVRDKSGGTIGFFAESWVPSGRDPWWTNDWKPRPEGYLGGKWPSALFGKFPWRSLQVVRAPRCSARTWEPCPWRR
jgi:hypothetical protein